MGLLSLLQALLPEFVVGIVGGEMFHRSSGLLGWLRAAGGMLVAAALQIKIGEFLL